MKLKMRPLHRMTYIALLAALAMMCMLLFGIKLIPGASYLKYDPSGGVILLCGLLLGPAAGLECTLVKNILYFLVHGGSTASVPEGQSASCAARLAVWRQPLL